MKTTSPFAMAMMIIAGLLGISTGVAQTFTGNNAPGTATNFSFSINGAATNLSVIVPGDGSAYSHLLIKRGSAPTDSDYDFISAFPGQTNALHLEVPELSAGSYFILVRTPAASVTHNFTVLIQTNVTDMRSAARPASKRLDTQTIGGIAGNERQYFRFEHAGNSALSISLDGTNVFPDLYVQRGGVPTDTIFLKRSLTTTNDLIGLLDTEALAGSYFIGVFAPSGTPANTRYTLRIETLALPSLTWDPGLTHEGTVVHSNFTGTAGDFYFRITTANPSLGAWRTALKLFTNDANLYLSRGTLPTPGVADFKSERAGSDGFVLGPSQFNPNEAWYLLVRASANARWTLVSGAPYVQDLGSVAEDGSSGSGSVEMGPEGIRFFSATAPVNMLAWRLWLNGESNLIFLKKTSLPLPTPLANEQIQAGQTLVVPPYLAGGQQYLIGVAGTPGTNIVLDSRQQPVADLLYGASASSTVTGFGYTTYRVQVPPQQVAWQLTLPSTNGNPNFAVRRNTVPNENNNDAFSELTNAITDNISLVPPVLSDGTFYITVYGTGPHQFTLQNGPAAVTDINYVSTILNDDTNRVGWRYYRVTDINQQLGSLGWELFLSNFAPGTRIGIRRNAAPSLWSYRNPNLGQAAYYDLLSTIEGLQQPGHQADIWYIGVYNPSNHLGAFTLTTQEIQATPLGENTPVARTNRPAGRFDFFRVDVPVTVGATPLLGWDVRVINVSNGYPNVVIRRDAFPSALNTTFTPTTSTNWPSQGSWAATIDWTARQMPNVGGTNENGRILAMGMGRPLEPGTYYIGVINAPAYPGAISYSILSRWIGTGLSIPVRSVAIAGDSVTNSVGAREADYYSVVIPPNTRSWKIRLTTVSGEAMLVAMTNRVPNVLSEKRVSKTGKEHFVLMPPPGQDFLIPGTNYVAVVGEGMNPPDASRIGTNSSTYIFETLGVMPEIELGTLGPDLVANGTLEGGETIAYHFDTTPGTLGLWITLENRVGNPVAVSRGENDLADPGNGFGPTPDPYGHDGGELSGSVASGFRITVADPFPRETIMVKARQFGGTYLDASYTLRVEEILPQPITFNGGVTNVVGQDAIEGGYYIIDVPPGALGWDLRITNVTSGSPQLVVARDFIPIVLSTSPGFLPNSQSNWPSGARWAATRDWTERSQSATGTNEDGRILAMGLGRPLEPGRYYAAVLGTTTTPMSYTLVSRGIGAGMSIPVRDLAFTGGSISVTGLPPREAAYFRVQVPADAPSWRVLLNATNAESMLIASKDSLPNVLAQPNNAVATTGGRKMQKPGDEYLTYLPAPNSSFVAPGTYYLAVVSEGLNPITGRIGTGTVDFVLTSIGAATVRNLGQIGFADLVESNLLSAGDAQIYQFTVPAGTPSMEARLENRVGNPVMVLRQGSRIPDPGASGLGVTPDFYGHDNGENLANEVHPSFLNIPNPSNSVYTLVVMARGTSGAYSNGGYTLRLNASGSTTVDFDNGFFAVSNQPPTAWRYFRIAVPTNALGWDVRVMNVVTGAPRLVIRRESLPNTLSTTPWSSPGTSLTWPTNAQWAPGQDWTKRSQSADNLINEDGRVFAAGMGRPLEPGTYYVGVIGVAGSTAPMTYTLLSRGIGSGFTLPLVDVPFHGSASVPSLPAREAAYFRVVVPSNAPSWKVKLTGISGESMLVGLRGNVPNIDLNIPAGALASGKGMQKLGNDHFVLLPATGLTNLIPSTNYFAVVSEGVNPASPTRIGSGSSSIRIESLGSVTTNELGLLTSEDILYADVLEGGEVKAYQFLIPPGMLGTRIRLENRVGNPAFVLRTGDKMPDPGSSIAGSSVDSYGNEGGYTTTDGSATLFTLPNPLPGTYTLMVKGRQSGQNYPDASYTVRLQEVLVPELNFSADSNTNGLLNSVSGVLEDNERVFFKFVIPATNAGQPVIGWKLDLTQSSGLASMRVRRDLLPSDANAGSLMAFTTASAIIVPPFLTNGVWYVEVKGAGSTAFTLNSSPLALERPTWPMPTPNGLPQPPGLTLPIFGDTAIDQTGLPLADPSIFLQQGFLHYYAIDVPATNTGLLRVQLEAISGNPDLYLRYGSAPTLYHSPSGSAGTIFDRSMLANSTEYANWVPVDGKLESKLKPGRWYMAVRAAGNANARYRLLLSTGNVLDLPLHGPDLTNQLVAGGDWRYYRVQVPGTLPNGFNLTFSQQSGDVITYIRDTIPPGNGVNDLRDWSNDGKNHGPYPNLDLPGTYSFGVPPVRLDHVYYFGVRAVSDAVFSIRCTTNGAPNVVPETIPFYGGLALTNLPPFGQIVYRVDVPSDATRWKHAATHASGVQLHLEQGTLPNKTGNDDWRSQGASNSVLNQYLSGTWPWVSNQAYFLIVTNTTPLPQDFVFALDGRSLLTDDNDNDGLPDAWETQYFGNTGAQISSGDPDRDGVTNIEEYNEGTNPNDGGSFRPRLLTSGFNGTISRNPNASSYVLGSQVELTPAPAPGYAFIGWTGNASGRDVPLILTMDTHKAVGATFKLAGDDFSTAFLLSGSSATAVGTNVGMSKEPGEPNHAGNPGGKSIWWRWTAPSSGPVTITTAGSAFNTLLGVYTGPTVSNLVVVASDNNSGGTSNRSRVTFTATAGMTYNIAVDGVNGASSRVNLSLTLGNGSRPQLTAMARLPDGRTQFTIVGDANRTYQIEACEDLSAWTGVGSVITDGSGAGIFVDSSAASHSQRFYRASE